MRTRGDHVSVRRQYMLSSVKLAMCRIVYRSNTSDQIRASKRSQIRASELSGRVGGDSRVNWEGRGHDGENTKWRCKTGNVFMGGARVIGECGLCLEESSAQVVSGVGVGSMVTVGVVVIN
ncbi:hypothetical protein Tco_0922980 [Tanacetum coccineum]|uniref:Uncharacterized protein n=1 Tax=Tanacetum coccineum TaxID=301880 RepID=A0ABQ5CZT5_9ASTR